MDPDFANLLPERFTATQVELLALLVISSPWLWRQAQLVLWRGMNTLHYRFGAYRASLLLLGVVRRLPVTASARTLLEKQKISLHEALGETQTALTGARALTAHIQTDKCWSCANCVTNVFINAGLYREALTVDKAAAMEDQRPPGLEQVLVRFNQIEAVYNLGGWRAAGKQLEQLEDEVRPHPLVWNFYPIQRAWILAHTGQGAEALTALEAVDEQGIPFEYRSELHYTRAAALLAVHRHEDARSAAREGMKAARRASSHRNGLFLQGRITLAAGRAEDALAYFEQGARHRYQAQGGDALLAWGDGLKQLGRTEEAREVWRLVLERDPQSGAAAEAASRLRSSPPA